MRTPAYRLGEIPAAALRRLPRTLTDEERRMTRMALACDPRREHEPKLHLRSDKLWDEQWNEVQATDKRWAQQQSKISVYYAPRTRT
jgi:hypothetical protein